jgi:MFS family permease
MTYRTSRRTSNGTRAHAAYNQGMTASIRELAVIQPLRQRSFRVVWLGESVSMLGDQFYLIALPWLTLELTGSSLALGLVLMAAAVPRAALMLLGGALTDRFEPRTIMIASSIARAIGVAVLAALVLTDAIALWHLYLLGAAFGAADAFYQPAALALIPRMVRPERLEASNALVMGSMAVTNMIGPAIAGVVIATAGTALGFGIDAATFVFAVAALASLRRRAGLTERAAVPAGGGTLTSIGEGLRYAYCDPQIRTLLLAVTVINFAVVGPFFVGLPALVAGFAGGPIGYGIVLSSWGAAALAGAIVAGSVGARARLSAVVPGTSLAMAAALLLIGAAPNTWAAALAAVPLGAAVGFLQVSGMAWLQRRSAQGMQGRVMSLVMFAVMGLTPISYAIAGGLAEIGPALLFAASGAVMLALAAATHRTPNLRADATMTPACAPGS